VPSLPLIPLSSKGTSCRSNSRGFPKETRVQTTRFGVDIFVFHVRGLWTSLLIFSSRSEAYQFLVILPLQIRFKTDRKGRYVLFKPKNQRKMRENAESEAIILIVCQDLDTFHGTAP